ncbi:M20/M25/M40 family metallo-hydrolase [Ichthyenterobacterium magnum]|uniref:Zn-dependent M28 family amino/carboxypeptidase n=1 Tax=Ichthyenterobacterium magnum TaxID=1230530 RepID=A0A420DKU2_9FLAO|nr:M20/M25/M40 family metallo-hydrolase [Ichthyenterobacterium magnum]RKE94886.1 Zn-dependent M28 family amino/carboxypeptidase [Ichthyenterobacterium magnum]
MKNYILLATIVISFILSCKAQNANPEYLIKEENVVKHIKTLASDEFLGRKPGTKGEEKTTKYIEQQLKLFNVEPANASSYFQDFKIKKVQYGNCSNLVIESGKEKKEYIYEKDFYAKTSYKLNEEVTIENAEMIFVGFGIVASDYNWDDYKEVDVKGKIVVVLFSDPGYYSKDPKFFNGEQPTYYAGIRHKKREAAKRGAAGLIMIHDDAINWDAVKNDVDSPIFVEGEPGLASDGLKFSGLISKSIMKDLLSDSNYDYVEEALLKDFKPLPLKAKASLSLNSTFKDFVTTKNVVGIVKGSKRPNEYVLYTAHWDHVGTRASHLGNDSIFNGAIDNASGTAMQLEVARAFSKMKKKTERSIVFLFTSAEEMGLLGAEYYANNPLYPLNKTVCVINADASFAVEKMRMVINVIESHSEMDSFVSKAADKLGREIVKTEGEEMPGNVFQRSDHYPFVKKGVPAVWNVGNYEPLNGDEKEVEKIAAYMQHYHQVTDEYYEGFNGANITFDAQLNFLTGLEVGNSSKWPNWSEESRYSQYKKIRDESMKAD